MMEKSATQYQLAVLFIVLTGLLATSVESFIVDLASGQGKNSYATEDDHSVALEFSADYVPLTLPEFVEHRSENEFPPMIIADRSAHQDPEVKSFTSGLLKSIRKRTSYANSIEEIQSLEDSDANIGSAGGIGLLRKRNEGMEQHSGGCDAQKVWIQLGADHFPRFVKSYNCTSNTCNSNFGACRPKAYSVKVLRMNSPDNLIREEECDQHLPEKLRCDWKLVSVMVTTYCECFSSIGPFDK